ncbi:MULTISPECIES: malate:quinone oxidoreductase [unclassified Prochlorococcus]|uniref:malate:quinone oxidoreductase n=1 Tax=unclassified Prochlorococcus TaxID=2627481 RepID=UPI0005338AD8|nr:MULTISPECIES: malate:quinone oxidoreductase [unclassified Prochlorococcus]KGG26735.1 Malate:quinone oxidoreductase [Prochlorococcus sp. MIT 0702]KGG29400.1 Malate:quinone oxidoreductase [Prochlorococcus sp. MIT 0701]KGG33701.1 Malate:quinone oxidoreductase [Prochlorococcus sp. MIT 0703]
MAVSDVSGSQSRYDAVLVGAGIMSATLAALLHELDPQLRLLMVERLQAPGLESSAAVNNAGTGHAANCELNYTPLQPDGRVSTAKALAINAAFERSLEFWASLTEKGKLLPQQFLHLVPHISVVFGDADVALLHQRFQQLSALPAFASMQWSTDFAELAEWMPLVMEGRANAELVAATRIKRGTDVDFGLLTGAYLESLQASGALELSCCCEVVDLRRQGKAQWHLDLKHSSGSRSVQTPFVFLGAGGGALPLLQRSGIPEAAAYAGFPVSGEWLVCTESALTARHYAKVYGKAKVGAPPMSVPHLDSRWIAGRRSLLFGPYAGFSSKFLKQGSRLDLLRSVRRSNFGSMLEVGLKNFDLVTYLISQLRQSEEDRFASLRDFLPNAQLNDWNRSVAGQRVQIIKRTAEGGRLQLGTEVVSAADGSLAALLGASPGASTAVTIMLEVLQRCWSERMESESWKQRLRKLLPSYGQDLNSDPELLKKMRTRTDGLIGFGVQKDGLS